DPALQAFVYVAFALSFVTLLSLQVKTETFIFLGLYINFFLLISGIHFQLSALLFVLTLIGLGFSIFSIGEKKRDL
ncbi:MAG: hypothetical protein AAFU64_15510, partial [Bacteroidota bacterium]